MAEAHPVGFRWVMKAKERGATVIHVDPRFGRTSQLADLHVPIRAGSDVAFLGGLIRHVIETDRTSASTSSTTRTRPRSCARTSRTPRISAACSRAATRRPRRTTRPPGATPAAGRQRRLGTEHSSQAADQHTGAGMAVGAVSRDETLEHPRCVFQVLRRHFARYTPEMVQRVCGISPEDFRERRRRARGQLGPRAHRAPSATPSAGRSTPTGVQVIRAGAILQLLLGNIGRPGGGIMALRGHASIQGSTDIPTLYDLLPGYLQHAARARRRAARCASYVDADGKDRGWWAFFDAYIVSLLKAWFGDAATAENDFGFAHLPQAHRQPLALPDDAARARRRRRRAVRHGPEPGGRSQHAGLQRRALASLKWLVVRDLVEIETATFWRDAPEIESGELRTRGHRDRGLPHAGRGAHREGGHVHEHAAPAAVARQGARAARRRALGAVVHASPRAARARALRRARPASATGRSATSPGTTRSRRRRASPTPRRSLREINGYDVATGSPVPGFTALRRRRLDGVRLLDLQRRASRTASTRRAGATPATSTRPAAGSRPSGAGPGRPTAASSTTARRPTRTGKPWSERKRYVWWDEAQGSWTGYDVPDFPVGKRPDYAAPDDARRWTRSPATTRSS